jgi:hypothetical protein
MRLASLLIAASWALSGCFGFGGGGNTTPNPAVERINSETDCSVLQGEFDTAEKNGHTDYMTAADKRMKSLGCYD